MDEVAEIGADATTAAIHRMALNAAGRLREEDPPSAPPAAAIELSDPPRPGRFSVSRLVIRRPREDEAVDRERAGRAILVGVEGDGEPERTDAAGGALDRDIDWRFRSGRRREAGREAVDAVGGKRYRKRFAGHRGRDDALAIGREGDRPPFRRPLVIERAPRLDRRPEKVLKIEARGEGEPAGESDGPPQVVVAGRSGRQPEGDVEIGVRKPAAPGSGRSVGRGVNPPGFDPRGREIDVDPWMLRDARRK